MSSPRHELSRHVPTAAASAPSPIPRLASSTSTRSSHRMAPVWRSNATWPMAAPRSSSSAPTAAVNTSWTWAASIPARSMLLRLDPRRPRHHLHPRDRAVRPGQRVGPLGRAPHRQPGRQRGASTVGARHRRGLRGLPRPLRPRRQVPDLCAGAQPRHQGGRVPDATRRLPGPAADPLAAGRRPPRRLAGHPRPTKDLVVFETFGHGPPEGSQQDIATVPATCFPLADCTSKIRYVTNNGPGPATSYNPAWSPNGTRIAFTNVLPPPGQDSPPIADIWTARQRQGPAAGLALPTVRVPTRLGSCWMTLQRSGLSVHNPPLRRRSLGRRLRRIRRRRITAHQENR